MTSDPRADRLIGLPPNVTRILSQDPDLRSDSDLDTLHSYYVSTVAPSRQPLRDARDLLSKKLAAIKPTTSVPILSELAQANQRQTHVQLRGNYKVKGDLVSPGVPSAFHPWKPQPSGVPAA